MYLKVDYFSELYSTGGWRLNGFVLSVGQTSEEGFNYQVCYRDKTQGGPYTEGPGDTIRGRCTEGPVRGDVVQVMQTNFYPLSLCEIIIYGKSYCY